MRESILKSFAFITPRGQILRKAKILANAVDVLKDKYRQMTDEQLSGMTVFFHQELDRGLTLDDILPDALAVARETAYRVHGIFAYYVQLVGAIIVHNGDFAEMKTGEGKTLTLVLVAYLNALSRKGVHIVTVNEYLVKRDAEFCAQTLNPLGITVGYNTSEMDRTVKQKMFNCDITYTTNSELGFDYLRDNMVFDINEKVLRGLNFAIVDEADSVLIDESRTPLIISGQPKKDVSLYVVVDEFVHTLVRDDYVVDLESNSIGLSESGVAKAQKYFKINNLYDVENSNLVHKIRNALMANYILRFDVEYTVKNDKIILIDHFTGRILEGRTYNAGLHQAIQAKEKVTIEPENIIVATITYQSFFRLYNKLSGVSGTALTEATEFLKTYNMVVIPVPTNKKMIRKDLIDYVFETKKSKWQHVVAQIEQLHKNGQPILVGTASVEDSEELAYYLRNKGLHFELLNAKNNQREAEIVKLAGQKGAITISTNMAGRGTDIKLGPGVRELGGLYVIGTDRNDSRRIDNQLCGRSGRQGDPGTSRFFISLEDNLFRRFLGEKQNKASKKIKDEEVYDSGFFMHLVQSLQKKIEGLNYDMRKHLIDYDIVLNNQRELVYKQRDQILKNKKNFQILDRMVQAVSKDLAKLFPSPINHAHIDNNKMAEVLNQKIFFSPIVPASIFKDLSVEHVAVLLMKVLGLSCQAKIDGYNRDQINPTLQSIILQNLDSHWSDHLDVVSKIRESVSLRSLEQKSPLNIYIEEADKHFEAMKRNIAHKVVLALHQIYVPKYTGLFLQLLRDENVLSEQQYQEALSRCNIVGTLNVDLSESDHDPQQVTSNNNDNQAMDALKQLQQIQETQQAVASSSSEQPVANDFGAEANKETK